MYFFLSPACISALYPPNEVIDGMKASKCRDVRQKYHILYPYNQKKSDVKMNKEILWLDGELADSRANQNLFDHALHYGTGVFEGIRVYSGKPFLLEAHMVRLLASARSIGLECPFGVDTLAAGALRLIEENRCRDSYLRPLMWVGGPQLGILPRENAARTAILAWDWPRLFDADAADLGITVTTDVPFRRPPANVYPAGVKATAGYMTAMLNRRAAVSRGFDDALQLDLEGNVAEVTGANIFAVVDGALVTPAPTCFLNGLTRQTIIALAKAVGNGCIERTVTVDELSRAEEVFVTGTAYEILPIRRVDDRKYQVGQVTKRLREAFFALSSGSDVISTALEEYSI